MSREKTIFQRLQQVLTGTSVSPSLSTNNTYSIHSDNSIIDTATSKADYQTKLLQAKQQKLLGRQWVKAHYDITNQSLSGLNEIKLSYRDSDLMDAFPEIGAALDAYAEESCTSNDKGFIVNVFSKSERIKSILQDLFTNRLNINIILPMICRSMCKYGNTYMLLNLDQSKGVLGWKQLPVYEIERYENGMDCPYASSTVGYNLNNVNEKNIDKTKFVWVGQSEYIPYREFQIAHFRLLYDSQFLPYGCLTGDTRIETENGYQEISKIKNNDKVWTFNIETHERELSEVTMKMDKGVKDTFLLETAHYYIEGTSDHKILSYNNGKLSYKEIGELKKGDLIVCTNSKKKEHKEKIIIDKSLPETYENNKRNIKWWTDFIDNVPDYVTNDFAELFGFLLGDGWISHGYHTMFALGEYKSLNDKYIDILHRFSGKNVHFVKNTNKKRKLEYHTAFVGSKMLVTILKRMGFNGNVYTKRIPDWVFNADNEIKQSFLNGIINADGSLKIVSDKICYSIELANEPLIKDIKTLAQSLGYRVGKIGKRNRVGCSSETITTKPIIVQHESFYIYFYQEENKEAKKNRKIEWKQRGLILEKIKRITPTGKKQTYDITIGNSNSNFFANGIVTHNCSILNKARRHFRMLSMMEDMMLVYRLDRSVERRVFKINVGAIDEADVPAYVQQIADNFKRTPIVDPMTGQIDLRKNVMNNLEDFFIPVRDDNASNPIETLSAGQNLTAMDDIKYIQNKVLTALRIPKSFLNFDEAQGDGKNLSLLDVRFTRTVNRVQQALIMELNKIAIIHLCLLGFFDELSNFTLTMNNPSSQAEMMEIENLAKKITTAKDAVSDPGGGIPLTSMTWAWKNIMKWSDKEIQRNLEEIRLETALAAELQKTTQIIKKTGMFDPVDNVYGEPGAEYQDSPDTNGEDGGMSASGGGGGMPIGTGDMSFDDGMSDDGMETGEEGDMSMEDTANEDNAAPEGNEANSNQGDNGGVPNLGEMILHGIKNKMEQKKKAINKNAIAISERYSQNLIKRLVEVASTHKEKKNEDTNDIYLKTLSLNEELEQISKELKHFDNKNK